MKCFRTTTKLHRNREIDREKEKWQQHKDIKPMPLIILGMANLNDKREIVKRIILQKNIC